MLHIANHRSKPENLLKKFPDAVIADVTSNSDNGLVRLSPFYPHGGIPVVNSEGVFATCVEAVWQGLKVFENCGIDTSLFANDTMKNLKRTVRKFGKPLGHQFGVNNTELLGYIDARKKIYIPTYIWVLENKVSDIVERMAEASKTKNIILLDYNTNCDVEDGSKPLSHASIIKKYIEDKYGLASDAVEPKQLNLF